MGLDAMIFVFWMSSFKPTFFTLLFHFHHEALVPLLSAIRVVSYAYMRLLIFLLAILVPACASSSLAFLMMYSAFKLKKQGDNMHPWRTPFSIWNQCVGPCLVLTVASWPAYRFLRRQVKWVKITQPCPTLCDPMGYRVHGILQARILEWVAFSFPGDLPNPGINPRSPTLQANSLPADPPGNSTLEEFSTVCCDPQHKV